MIRVLLADDHAIVRKGLKQIILNEYPSAFTAEASDVESLVSHVVKQDWDVVICDISMPVCSCLEALSQVKDIKPEIPVLIMSMPPEDQYALRVIKVGATDYLNKDTIHDELIKAIQIVQIGRKFITPTIAEKLAGAGM